VTIETKSSFIFDFIVGADSTFLNFNEGGPELTTEVNVGSYSMTDMASEVARALNAIGSLDYTVTVDRNSRVFTISGTGAFDLLCNSGSNVGLSAWTIFGFDTGADRNGGTSYLGDNSAGKLFKPQFHLQDYISFDNWQGFASSNVNESASGVTEIYSLGSRFFSEFNIKYQNNGLAGSKGSSIDFDSIGVDNLREFMQFAITKGPIEFIENRETPAGFETMILESSPGSSNGTEFKLKELLGQNLAGYFETGKLKFRKQG